MEALVDSIYRVAFDPDHWPVLMRELAQFCGASTTYLFSPPFPGTEVSPLDPLFGYNFDRDTVGKLLDDYSDQDCVSGAVFAAVNNDYRYVSGFSRSRPTAEILKSTYRNECMRGCDTGDALGLLMRPMQTTGGNPTICIAQPWGGSSLTQAQANRFQALAPHFHRLGRLIYEVLPTAPIDPALRLNLDLMPTAALLLNANGTVLHANPRAETVATPDRGLTLCAASLSAISQNDHAKLGRVIAAALDPNARQGGEIIIRGEAGLLTTVLVVPLSGGHPGGVGTGPARAIVYLLDHGHSMAAFPGAQRLTQTFGLTSAETDITIALINGQTPEEISGARQRSIATIRSQIHAIFGKTGICRASELSGLRQLIEMPLV